MILGFTGTRKGMTPAQREVVEVWLRALRPVDLHHGGCVGADAEVHWLTRKVSPLTSIYGHPCTGTAATWRDTAVLADCSLCFDPHPPLERNRAIVAACDVLLVCPAEVTERVRGSGTWATWRAAKRMHKPWVMVAPDGVVSLGAAA